MKKEFWKRTTAGILAGIIGITSIAWAVHAEDNDKNDPAVQNQKEETVYIIAEPDGTPKKIIVSDWLKNNEQSEILQDVTSLSQIENVKGEETFTLNDEQETLWNARGKDIYYKGVCEQDLPVDVRISYKLDGTPVSAQDLAGKSGKVTIRFDYENHQYEMKEINGEMEKVYVPFVMLSGMILDGTKFSNVEITNGKLVQDGDRTVVIGIAFPGLKEDLHLDTLDVEIPESVEITADVTDFSLGMTMTIAVNELFSELDPDNLTVQGSLDDSMTKLTDSMTKLVEGSSALEDGLSTLLTKSQELVSGINQLSDGAAALKTGAGNLSSGVGQLQNGAASLTSGLNQITAQNSELTGGARQVFASLLSMAESQIASAGLSAPALTIDNYADVLTSIIASLDDTAVYEQALSQVTAAVEANRPAIETAVTETVRSQVQEQVQQAVSQQISEQVQAACQAQVEEAVIQNAVGMTPSQYTEAVENGLVEEAVQQAIAEAVASQMASEEIQTTLETTIAAKMESEEVLALIQSKTDEQMAAEEIKTTITQNVELQVQKAISDNMASDEVQEKLKAASEGAQALISLKTSLDSYNSFYLGIIRYTGAVSSAAEGAASLQTGLGSLASGVSELNTGINQLYTGTSMLKTNVPALVTGVTELKNGSSQLSTGLQKFNKEGVEKIVEAINTNLGGITDRIRILAEVSKNYRNYSGISAKMGGTVKFIYRTEEIKSE